MTIKTRPRCSQGHGNPVVPSRWQATVQAPVPLARVGPLPRDRVAVPPEQGGRVTKNAVHCRGGRTQDSAASSTRSPG
jgi:hypothetical protein